MDVSRPGKGQFNLGNVMSAESGSEKGISMMSMLITMAVIAIVSSIAYPSYLEIMKKNRRSDAVLALVDLANRMERYYSEYNTYATATIGTGNTTDVRSSATTKAGFYTLSIVNSATTAANYKIKAVRVVGELQECDDVCGDFTLTDTEVRGITGTGNVKECWK